MGERGARARPECWRRGVLAALLLLLLPLYAGSLAHAADDLDLILERGEVRIGVCLGIEPLGFRDSNGDPAGYDVDVAKLLAEALGVRLELVEVTVGTRMRQLLEGRIDVIACTLTATTQRAREIAFSFPYLRTGLKILARRGAGINRLADVSSGSRLLVMRNTTGESLIAERFPGVELTYVDTPGEAVLLLQQGAADLFIEDGSIVDHFAAEYPQVVALSEMLSRDSIAFGIRKGNPELLRWLDLFASIFVSSGNYAATYARWWAGEPPPISATW